MSDFAEGDMKGLHSEDVDGRHSPRSNGNGSKPSRSDPDERPSNQGTSGDEVTCHAAELVTKLLREENDRARTNKTKKEISARDTRFLFNRHTITYNNKNEEVDFRQAARAHLKTECVQRWVSARIEMAKLRHAGKLPLSCDTTPLTSGQDINLKSVTRKTDDGTFVCTCGRNTDPNQMCIQCYNEKYFNFGFRTPYVFNSSIEPYKQPEMSTLPEVNT